MRGGKAVRSVARWMPALALCALLTVGLIGAAPTEAAGTFRIRGHVSNLVPGVPRTLVLRVRNPFRYAIRVRRITVRVRSPIPVCPAFNVKSPGFRGSRRIRAGRLVRIRVSIMMAPYAPNACQGRIFRLVFSARATRA